MLRRFKYHIATFFAVIGPGFITAMVDNDAGGIFTYSQAGARYGYLPLWTLLPITLLLVVAQEMCSRMGAVTGKGLSDLIREEYGLRTTFFLMAASNTPDKVTSQTAEVNALPATPTPTPAPTATPPPTPIPPPLITVFKASSGASPANEAEVAQILDPSLPATTFKYEVLAGARVKFSWAATGADTVKLNGANVPNPGDTTVPLTSATPWNLVATNAGGSSTRFIVITLRPRPVPPPPSQFTGQNS
ncbi:MAG TPA: divalent metal cation transporter, partial [Anaerolineaceae bacterium]|nr:divalent metal cation transporter [Anaerolineaceae bacterium]